MQTGRPAKADRLRVEKRVTRATIIHEWLAKLEPVNPATDPFHNPVGHTVGEVLPILADVALGERPLADAAEPLDRLMRIRAVQEVRPSEAVGFLLPHASLALMAFDAYMRCREELHAIQLRELRKRVGA